MLTSVFASIALTVVLSLAAVRSAPVAIRADFVPQACSGTNGSGTCVDIATAPVGQHVNAAGCTNVDSPKSLKLNIDNDCVSFTNKDCVVDFASGTDFATEHFSDDADINDLTSNIQSIQCETDPGTVNGLFPQ
ncbi:hypothetical protein DFH06DRAFT_1295754 [Mycena polygramma]|nr:hypothetical protein DFH06DRAFT_1295754 [Mycena polygramma]